MKKLIIDRQKWLRGEGIDDSFLLRERDCKMCCLGFLCLLLGLTPEEIVGKTTPAQLEIDLRNLPPELEELVCNSDSDEDAEPAVDSETCTVLTQANDTILHTHDYGHFFANESAREEFIAKTFLEELGVEVEFIN